METFEGKQSTARRLISCLGLGSGAVMLGLLVMKTPSVARSPAAAQAGMEASEDSDHLVRRCVDRSKQELCYWARVEARHDAKR